MSGKCEKHGYVLCPQCAIDKENGTYKDTSRSESRNWDYSPYYYKGFPYSKVTSNR